MTAMKKAQQRRLQQITNRLARQTHHDGVLTFKAEVQPCGTVLFSATNIYSDTGGLRWFERTADLYCLIGPRGGVRKYAGSIGNWEFN